MKNPILFVLTVAFVIVNIVDAITAFFILPGESNPLFIVSGSIWIVLILKFLFVAFTVFIYNRNIFPSNFWYYSWMMIMILGSLVVGLGATSNIIGMNSENYSEEV